MPVRRASRAFLWRLNATNFKATYGRFSSGIQTQTGDKSYAKNYLQVPQELRGSLDQALGHSGQPGEGVDMVWRWPGGEVPSKYFVKDTNGDNRGQLYISQGTGGAKQVLPPFAPGKVGNPLTAIDGDPSLPLPADATALLDQILKSGSSPWYMAVALEGDTGILHARMILENPPSGKTQFGIARQPKAIRDAIASADGASFLPVDLLADVRAEKVVGEILDAFQRSPNVLLVGPPGCGKTVAMEDMIRLYEESCWFDTDRIDPWVAGASKVYETAFHPSMSYENFVAGLMPKVGQGIELEVRSGPLLNMAQWCRTEGREGLLVIDEFNRGPASAIFGDALVLLDKGKRDSADRRGATIAQPHADRDIQVPPEFAADAPFDRLVPKKVSLPANLRLLGAFNSSDRSVTPPDAALLRRFSTVRVGPDPFVLARHFGLTDFGPDDVDYQDQPVAAWTAEDVRRLAVHVLISLNQRLGVVVGEDHLLGHALLWEVPAEAARDETMSALVAEFEEKIVGRLRITLRDKDDQLALILNAADPGNVDEDGVAIWNEDDNPVGRRIGAKLAIRNLKSLPFAEQLRGMLSVVRPLP